MINNETDEPLVSIITTCFNAEKTLDRAIKSVLGQTYKNIQYIIIDGASTDTTVSVIKRYEDKIGYWMSEKDKGISDGWNKGLKKVKGKIIGILNADDWYESDTIEKIVAMDKKYGKDFYIGALRYWSNDKDNFVALSDKDFAKKIFYKMPQINHPASFFNKSVYDDVGNFNIKARYAMDYEFILRAIKSGHNYHVTNEIFTNMYLGGNSDANALKSYREVLRICPDKTKGTLWFCYSAVKLLLRKAFISLGLEGVIYRFRLSKYKNIKDKKYD